MSLVITPRLSSLASSRQIRAISDDLPVPTGPATPSRRVCRPASEPIAGASAAGKVMVDKVMKGAESGTEQPLARDGMDLGPLLDQRRAERGDLLDGGQLRQVDDHTLDVL